MVFAAVKQQLELLGFEKKKKKKAKGKRSKLMRDTGDVILGLFKEFTSTLFTQLLKTCIGYRFNY